MLVKDIMTPSPLIADPYMSLPEAVALMKEKKIRRLPVVSDGKLIGIVTDRDLKEAGPSKATVLSMWELQYILSQTRLQQFMQRKLHSIGADESVEKAALTMLQYKIGGLPVLADGKLVGIVTESDIFRALSRMLGADKGFLKVVMPLSARTHLGQLVSMPQLRTLVFDDNRPEIQAVFAVSEANCEALLGQVRATINGSSLEWSYCEGAEDSQLLPTL